MNLQKPEINDLTEKQISRQNIYKGNIVNLVIDDVKLPNGKNAKREIILHSGGVVILPITKEGNLVLVEQFRYATGQTLLEFPAGRLNKHEDPKLAAVRELKEETGFKAVKIESLNYIFMAPGFCNERLFTFVATDLQAGEPQPDEDEFVRTIILSPAEFKQKIIKSEIIDAKTLSVWSIYCARNF